MKGGPTILVSLPVSLVERLLPGAIEEAEALASGFEHELERAAWIAGRLGAQIAYRETLTVRVEPLEGES